MAPSKVHGARKFGRPVLLAFITLLVVLGQASLAPALRADTLEPIAYLPLVLNNLREKTLFGMDLVEISNAQGLQQTTNTRAYWVRQAAVHWSTVEATEGVYDFTSLTWLETGLVNASQRGLTPIVVVRSTPSWAQLYTGVSCGPIKDTKLAAFGDFMYELVSRYSVPPYNGLYWEIWNEPDIDPDTPGIAPDSLWGCWGDDADTTGYGGGYYADMLEAVYPRVKDANPNAQVVLGGLLMDCDPAVISPCNTSKFLEGILDHNDADDGGDFFDAISFHAYDFASTTIEGRFTNPNWGTSNDDEGPVLINKTQFIETALAAHSVTGKYLMNTESAVICNYLDASALDCQNPTARLTKEYYVAQSFAAAIAEGLEANIWYTLKGWRGSALIDGSLNPYPAYTTYSYAGETLWNATWYANYSNSNVTGYKFHRSGTSNVWLLWSHDGSNHSINLGATPSAIRDVYGVTQTASQNITVGKKPLYIFGLP